MSGLLLVKTDAATGKPIIVKVSFPQTETSLNDCLTGHYRTL
jgi:hypothetical protein